MDFVLSVSYLELYMEDLRDLLDSSTPGKEITIREDDQANTGKQCGSGGSKGEGK